jgi:hypothetical protein
MPLTTPGLFLFCNDTVLVLVIVNYFLVISSRLVLLDSVRGVTSSEAFRISAQYLRRRGCRGGLVVVLW